MNNIFEREYYYFSASPRVEKRLRLFTLACMLFMAIVLYLFWQPLRDPAVTYYFVSATVTSRAVHLLFSGITILGSEGFFLVFLALVYWFVDRDLGFWGLVLMPVSIFLTSEIPKDILRLPRPDIRGITVPTYTFPSGHTSGAVSVWGFLAITQRNRLLWAWVIAVVTMVGLSRVMLGYHYPGDVIGGLIAGIVFLALFFPFVAGLVKRESGNNRSLVFMLLAAVTVPLVLSFLPATYAPNLMGYLAGALAGRLLERQSADFTNSSVSRQHWARALIGLAGIALIMLGGGILVPPGASILIFFRHALTVFWIIYLAPVLFRKTGLNKVNTGPTN